MARKTVSGNTQEDAQLEAYWQWFQAGEKKAGEREAGIFGFPRWAGDIRPWRLRERRLSWNLWKALTIHYKMAIKRHLTIIKKGLAIRASQKKTSSSKTSISARCFHSRASNS
jgi:hypothetical protein